MQESVPQQLRYAGYWYDNELAWYWLTVRSYDPALERFLEPDPSEIEGLFSYVYVGDNPSDASDPSGLETCVFNPSSSGDPRQAKGTDCDDDPAGVHEDITPPENNIAVDGITGVGGRHVGDALSLDPRAAFCAFLRHAVNFDVCGLPERLRSDFVNAVHLICGSGVCRAVHTLCDIAGVCQDIETLLQPKSSAFAKLAALADLALWLPGLDEIKLVESLGKGAAEVVRLRKAAEIAGCALCFPAGTQITTPVGKRSIEQIKVGDLVLAENPATARVEAEPVQAVIHHSSSPLLAVDLSDGSSITVTADHPFWVDRGTGFAGPGWLAAGKLSFGDQLRTANGQAASVVGLRYNVGSADVYTLTVARDHTFFVGSTGVLVHNSLTFAGGGRSQGANRRDRRQVEDAARAAGLSQEQRRRFGDYIEELKQGEGKRGDVNYTYEELMDIAKDFLKHGC